jgi:hypothetical protein
LFNFLIAVVEDHKAAENLVALGRPISAPKTSASTAACPAMCKAGSLEADYIFFPKRRPAELIEGCSKPQEKCYPSHLLSAVYRVLSSSAIASFRRLSAFPPKGATAATASSVSLSANCRDLSIPTTAG